MQGNIVLLVAAVVLALACSIAYGVIHREGRAPYVAGSGVIAVPRPRFKIGDCVVFSDDTLGTKLYLISHGNFLYDKIWYYHLYTCRDKLSYREYRSFVSERELLKQNL